MFVDFLIIIYCLLWSSRKLKKKCYFIYLLYWVLWFFILYNWMSPIFIATELFAIVIRLKNYYLVYFVCWFSLWVLDKFISVWIVNYTVVWTVLSQWCHMIEYTLVANKRTEKVDSSVRFLSLECEKYLKIKIQTIHTIFV